VEREEVLQLQELVQRVELGEGLRLGELVQLWGLKALNRPGKVLGMRIRPDRRESSRRGQKEQMCLPPHQEK